MPCAQGREQADAEGQRKTLHCAQTVPYFVSGCSYSQTAQTQMHFIAPKSQPFRKVPNGNYTTHTTTMTMTEVPTSRGDL